MAQLSLARLPGALKALKENCLQFVAFNSNKSGGADRFRELRDDLKRCLDELPETLLVRGALMKLWHAMPTNVMKTAGSWRRFIFGILREGGLWDIRVDAALRTSKLSLEDIDKAIESSRVVLALADGDAGLPLPKRRKRSSGPAGGQAALLAIPAYAAATSGDAQPPVPAPAPAAGDGELQAIPHGSLKRFFTPLPAEIRRQPAGVASRSNGSSSSRSGGAAAAAVASATASGTTAAFLRTDGCAKAADHAQAQAQAEAKADPGAAGAAAQPPEAASASTPASGGARCGTSPRAGTDSSGAAGADVGGRGGGSSSSSRAPGAATGPPPRAAAPPSEAAAGADATEDPQGHYAALQVPPTASARDIHVAYKRQALRWHPDKPGGSEQEFVRCVLAYELLSDPARRAAYGRGGSRGGAGGSGGAGPFGAGAPTSGTQGAEAESEEEAKQAATAAAKAFFANMMLAPEEAWARLLAGASTEMLQRLDGLCRDRLGQQGRSRASQQGAEGSGPKAGGAAQGPTGLKWRPKSRDFFLQVAWRQFKIKPSFVTRDAEQAVDLHIALNSARAAATKRFQEFQRSAPFLAGLNGLDGCVPLTEPELWAIVAADPFVPMMFASDISISGVDRKQTPWTPCVNHANCWRVLIRQGLEQGRVDAVDAAKKRMADTAVQDRQGAAAFRSAGARGVRAELKRRGAAPGAAEVRAGAAAEEEQQQQLRLENIAAAGEIGQLQLALGDQQRALEAGQAVALRAIEDRDRAEEEVLRAREAVELATSRAEQLELEAERAREEHARLREEVASAHMAAAAARPRRFNPPPRVDWGAKREALVREQLRAEQRHASAVASALLLATSGEPDARRRGSSSLTPP